MPKGGKKSFLDEDDDVQPSELDIKVNKQYAQRFEVSRVRDCL